LHARSGAKPQATGGADWELDLVWGMQSVVVIGGGPAGSVAGLLLARAGMNVSLIEQHRFPRDKVCGECLSAIGIEVLERLRLAEKVRASGAVVLTKTSLHPSDGEGLTIALPKAMWGLSRRVLDVLQLEAAREAGVKVIQPARCEGMSSPHGVRYRNLESNEVQEIEADWVVLADGKGALGAKRSELTGELGLKAHFVGVAGMRDRIELFGVEGHYVGSAPIEACAVDGVEVPTARWNVAFSVPGARVQTHRRDLDSLWAALLLENRALAARFGGAVRVGEWLAAPLPRFGVAGRWPERVIPVGNAAAALEPIGGEGMGLAMRSAELAAEAILEAARRREAVDATGLRAEYRRLWDTRRAACRGMAMMLGSPMLATSGLELARNDERLSRVVMGLIGKW